MNPLCMYAAGMWGMITVMEFFDGRYLRMFGAAAVSLAFAALALA